MVFCLYTSWILICGRFCLIRIMELLTSCLDLNNIWLEILSHYYAKFYWEIKFENMLLNSFSRILLHYKIKRFLEKILKVFALRKEKFKFKHSKFVNKVLAPILLCSIKYLASYVHCTILCSIALKETPYKVPKQKCKDAPTKFHVNIAKHREIQLGHVKCCKTIIWLFV